MLNATIAMTGTMMHKRIAIREERTLLVAANQKITGTVASRV
jgi:hypothetical protein